MFTPVCVTPPEGPLVPLDQLKAFLSVDYADDDLLITSLEAAAVAHLDGWRGILGRCIQRQTWRFQFERWGELSLPFPDGDDVKVSYLDRDGVERVAEDAVFRSSAGGSSVCCRGPVARGVFVEASFELPEPSRFVVAHAVKMLAAHWYLHRSTVSETAMSQMPLAVDALISPLRWRRI